MNERVLKVMFLSLLTALVATFLLSGFFAAFTGYAYGATITEVGFPTLARGLGPVLGVAVLALLAINFSLLGRSHQIEQALLRWLEARGEWISRSWDDELERALAEGVQLGQFPDGGEDIRAALDERRSLRRLRVWSGRLFGVPAFGLAIIVGLSLWAGPGSMTFLESSVFLSTSLLFFTSYGAIFVVGALLAAFMLVLRE